MTSFQNKMTNKTSNESNATYTRTRATYDLICDRRFSWLTVVSRSRLVKGESSGKWNCTKEADNKGAGQTMNKIIETHFDPCGSWSRRLGVLKSSSLLLIAWVSCRSHYCCQYLAWLAFS